MYTRDLEQSDRFDRIATLDIETDGFDGRTNDLAAIGVGYYEAGTDRAEVEVVTRAASGNDEVAVIERAFEWVNRRDPPAVVTYNGGDFDLPFLRDRLNALEVEREPTFTGRHVDLYPPRKREADRLNQKWPRLEECLEAYGLPVSETRWDGRTLDNARFGEELAPRYLDALERADDGTVSGLEPTVREYAASDIEATIALYEADAGRRYEPGYVVR